MTKKILLSFPQKSAGQPMAMELIKTYNLDFNILKAFIDDNIKGTLLLEIKGQEADIEAGIVFLREHQIGVKDIQSVVEVDENKCVSCGACIKGCDKLSVDALKMENYRIVRNEEKCVGCGVCVTKCPTRAWTRSEKKYYRLTLMGRTGKKNPRLGEDFLIWADEDTIIKVILNTYKFVKEYIDPNAPGGKEHVGYIIDRVGFAEYKKWALDGVELPPETIVKDNIYWSGIYYR